MYFDICIYIYMYVWYISTCLCLEPEPEALQKEISEIDVFSSMLNFYGFVGFFNIPFLRLVEKVKGFRGWWAWWFTLMEVGEVQPWGANFDDQVTLVRRSQQQVEWLRIAEEDIGWVKWHYQYQRPPQKFGIEFEHVTEEEIPILETHGFRLKKRLPSLRLTVRPWKSMVGRWISFWDGLCSEASP